MLVSAHKNHIQPRAWTAKQSIPSTNNVYWSNCINIFVMMWGKRSCIILDVVAHRRFYAQILCDNSGQMEPHQTGISFRKQRILFDYIPAGGENTGGAFDCFQPRKREAICTCLRASGGCHWCMVVSRQTFTFALSVKWVSGQYA